MVNNTGLGTASGLRTDVTRVIVRLMAARCARKCSASRVSLHKIKQIHQFEKCMFKDSPKSLYILIKLINPYPFSTVIRLTTKSES